MCFYKSPFWKYPQNTWRISRSHYIISMAILEKKLKRMVQRYLGYISRCRIIFRSFPYVRIPVSLLK
jgi:hypothetical protein